MCTHLNRGASILAIDKDSNTPLLEAASEGSVEAFDKLLDLGAPLDDLDKNNKSAVFLAAEKNHVAILRVTEIRLRLDWRSNNSSWDSKIPLAVGAWSSNVPLAVGAWSSNVPLAVGAWSSNVPLAVGAWSSNVPLAVGAWSSNVPLAVGAWSSNVPLAVGAWSSNIPLAVGAWSSNIPLVVGSWSSNILLVNCKVLGFRHY